MDQLLDRSISARTFEKRYIRKDGSEVWSWTTVSLLEGADGEPLRFIGVIEDIGARKRAETALQDEARILELLNKTGQTLGSTLDLRALLQTITDAATALSGAQFGAFFYNTTDDNGDAFQLYTLSGAPREAFEKFGSAARHRALRPDVPRRGASSAATTCCRTRAMGTRRPHHGMPTGHLPVRSYLAVPVRSVSGEVLGVTALRSPAGRRVHRAVRAARGRRRVAGRHRARQRAALRADAQGRRRAQDAARKRTRRAQRRRADERDEGRLPRHALARAAHAAQRHRRLGADPPHARRRTPSSWPRGSRPSSATPACRRS